MGKISPEAETSPSAWKEK